jgi:hypothetical protein
LIEARKLAPLTNKRTPTDTPTMPAPDDWRRMGQEAYLLSATLTWKRYQALSPEWEREHCEFCFRSSWTQSRVPATPRCSATRRTIAPTPAITNVEDSGRPAGKWWVCEECLGDFKDEFGWRVVESDADAWPYNMPESACRPTAADYTGKGIEHGLLRRPDREA